MLNELAVKLTWWTLVVMFAMDAAFQVWLIHHGTDLMHR